MTIATSVCRETDAVVDAIPRGTLCHLLGGGVVRAYPDTVIGETWNGQYRVQAAGEIAWRSGVPRDQLTPVSVGGAS